MKFDLAKISSLLKQPLPQSQQNSYTASERIEKSMRSILFPRAMSQAAVLARTVGECREGQIPRPLGRCKLDTPLLAAGSLIVKEQIYKQRQQGTA